MRFSFLKQLDTTPWLEADRSGNPRFRRNPHSLRRPLTAPNTPFERPGHH